MLENLETRHIIVERMFIRNQASYGVKNTYSTVDRNVYASITRIEASIDSCSFTLAFWDREVTVLPDRLVAILNFPTSPHSIQMVFVFQFPHDP